MAFSRLHQAFDAKADAPEAGAPPEPEGPYAGMIASTPATMSDKVEVLLDRHGLVRLGDLAAWMPRADVRTKPQRGDRCLVALDEFQTPWVLVWWPYGS